MSAKQRCAILSRVIGVNHMKQVMVPLNFKSRTIDKNNLGNVGCLNLKAASDNVIVLITFSELSRYQYYFDHVIKIK